MLYVESGYQSIPPGNETGQLIAWLQLALSDIVTVKGAVGDVSFRVCMWGAKQHQLFLPSTQQAKVLTTRFEVRVSAVVLMKYLNDMGTLLIEAFDPRNTKRIGTVVVNLKRFQTVGNLGQPTISNFRQKFDIVSSNKQKIGEVTLNFQVLETPEAVDPMQMIGSIVEDRQEIGFEPTAPPLRPQITPKQPRRMISEEVQVQEPTKYIPHRPTQSPSNNRETKKRNTQQQTSEIYNGLEPHRPNTFGCNLSVEMMKLKEDEAMLLTDYPSLENNSNSANRTHPLQLSIEILNAKFSYKLSKLIDKLTVVYPQQSKSGHIQSTTTILTAVKASTSISDFNQTIQLTLSDNSKGSTSQLTLELYCGESSATFPIDKLVEAYEPVRILLKKKDGSKFCEISCRASSKALPKELNAVLYIGAYHFGAPGEYFIRLNSKQFQARTVAPASKTDFGYRMIAPAAVNPVIVLEVWRKSSLGESIHGVVKLSIVLGSCDQRVVVKAITGQPVGWLRLIHGLVKDVTELTNQIERRIKQPTVVNQQQRPEDIIVNPEPRPIIPPVPKAPAQQQLNFPELYLSLMESIRTSKNRQCKSKTDTLLEKQHIAKEEFVELLRLTNPTLTERQLNFFTRQFDYPLNFQQFFSSYLRYCFYERRIRLNLEELILLIQKQAAIEAIKGCMRKATLYYGFVEVPEFVGLLQQAGVQHDVALELSKYLMSDAKQHIFLDSFYELVEGVRTVHPFVFSHFVSFELLKSHSRNEIEESLKQYRQDSSHTEVLTQLENALLQSIEDSKHNFQFLRPEDLERKPEPSSSSKPDSPEESIIVDPKRPNRLDEDEENQPQRVRKVEVLISSVDCPVATITELIINREICLLGDQLPQTVLLSEGESVPVIIHTRQGLVLQGQFVAQQPNTTKIRLFCRGKEAGWLHFCQAKPSEVRIDITKKSSREQIQRKPSESFDELKPNLSYLLGETVSLEVVSIVPSGSYQLTIGDAVRLNYPIESTALIENTRDRMLEVAVIARNDIKGSTSIHLPEGASKYAVNRADGSVLCILEVRVTPTYGQPKPMPVGLKNLFLFISRLDCPLQQELPPNERLYFLVESDQYTKTKEFSFGGNRSGRINTTVQLKECKEYKLQLINSKREMVGQFRWSMDFTGELGIHRRQAYLVSGPLRLSVVLFEVNYNDDFSMLRNGPQKMQQLLKIFSAEGLVLLDKQLRQGKEFAQVMKDNFRFTHSEINVLEGLIGGRMSPTKVFSLSPQAIVQGYSVGKFSLRQLCEEFFLYDFDSQGFVKLEKARLVLSLLYKPNELEVQLQEFVSSNQRVPIQLVDLNWTGHAQFDYFKFLRHCELQDPTDPFFFGGPEDKESSQQRTADESHQQLKGKAVRITLLGYEDITYRNMPGTYLFKVGQMPFAEAVPRSFGHKFEEPMPFVQTNYPCLLKVFNKEYSVSELWKYTEICESKIEEVTKVLGGRVFFRIEEIQKALPKPAQKIPPKEPTKPIQPEEPIVPPRRPDPQPERPPTRVFPEMTPIKFQNAWDPDTLRKTLNNDDPARRDELQRFKRIFDQPIDLSKYNFEDSEDDE